MALPFTLTGSFSFAGADGGGTSTLNFGRLYSSTVTIAFPRGPSTTCSIILPVSRSEGAVKLPENEPKPLVVWVCLSISLRFGSLKTTVIFRSPRVW